MSGRILAVANMKGGVGKTTSTVMLAEGLALLPAKCGTRLNRVLLIDTDPQASLGYVFLGYDSLKQHIAAHRHVSSMMQRSIMLGQDVDAADYVIGPIQRIYGSIRNTMVDASLHLMASGPQAIHTERMVIRQLTKEGLEYSAIRKRILSFMRDAVLAHAKKHYDWVLVDCAPGLNMLTQSAISLADSTVVVTAPEPMSVFGLEVFLAGVWTDDEDEFPRPRKPLVLVSRMNANQVGHLHQLSVLEKPGSKMTPYRLLKTRIPESAQLDGKSFTAKGSMSLSARYGSSIGPLVKVLAAEVKECLDGN